MNEERTKDRRRGNGGDPEFQVIDRRPRFDDEAGPPPEPRYPTFVEELKARAEEAEQRAREISAAYRRIDEERDAFRERLSRDLERRVDIARADMMRRVIDVLDDLDRAIAAASSATDPTILLQGITIIRDRLFQVLASEGVQPVETLGHPFDPRTAEAIATVESDDPSLNDKVVEEIVKGYSLGDTLLRPARVRVGRARSPETEPPSPGPD